MLVWVWQCKLVMITGTVTHKKKYYTYSDRMKNFKVIFDLHFDAIANILFTVVYLKLNYLRPSLEPQWLMSYLCE